MSPRLISLSHKGFLNLQPYFQAISPYGKQTEKKKKHDSWVIFYSGQNEDYSPGDSISDSSEKLLQTGNGEGQFIYNFGGAGIHAIKHIYFAYFFSTGLVKVAASHKVQSSPWRILMLF